MLKAVNGTDDDILEKVNFANLSLPKLVITSDFHNFNM